MKISFKWNIDLSLYFNYFIRSTCTQVFEMWTSRPIQCEHMYGTMDYLSRKFTSRPQKLNIGTRQPYHSSVHTILYVYISFLYVRHTILFRIHAIILCINIPFCERTYHFICIHTIFVCGHMIFICMDI